MAEIIFMKTLKIFLAWICYMGAGVVFIDQVTGVNIEQITHVPDPAKEIILWMLIVFWCIKIAWFIWEKFWLESRERNQRMKIEKGENSPSPKPYRSKVRKLAKK